MAVVFWSERAAADLERVLEFLLEHSPQSVESANLRIHEVARMLGAHPLLGREVEHGLREVVISYGRAGYVALYDFDEVADEVWIHALRHQREL